MRQITVSKEIETVIKLETLTRVVDIDIITSRSAFEQWVKSTDFVIEVLKPEITYQIGIPEIAYGIKGKIKN